MSVAKFKGLAMRDFDFDELKVTLKFEAKFSHMINNFRLAKGVGANNTTSSA